MKRIFLAAGLLINLGLHAQHIEPVFDKTETGFEVQPANLYLEADKDLCELKEIVSVHVRIRMADKDNGVPHTFAYKFRDPFDAPWTIGDFKIISGGASIVMTDGPSSQLQMPASMPAEKAVMVQVTLNPVVKKYKQVQLFTSIYLEDNDNVFTLHCPYLGINHEKYVIKFNGGALANSDKAAKTATDKHLPQTKSITDDYKVLAAQADINASIHNLDLAALTSNAKAIYAKEEDLTTILINDNNIEMVDGIKTSNKRMYSIALSFPGRSAGSFAIKSDKKITASITLPQMRPGYVCSCTDDPTNTDPDRVPPTCMGGTITITKYDGKTVEGFVIARLENQDPTTNPPVTFYSTLNGKFKVKLAN